MKYTAYRARLRSVLHCVLRQIAEQVPLEVDGKAITGTKAMAAWKRAFALSFIGGRSTESLTDEQLKAYTLEVESFAAQYLGVSFAPRTEEETA